MLITSLEQNIFKNLHIAIFYRIFIFVVLFKGALLGRMNLQFLNAENLFPS